MIALLILCAFSHSVEGLSQPLDAPFEGNIDQLTTAPQGAGLKVP